MLEERKTTMKEFQMDKIKFDKNQSNHLYIVCIGKHNTDNSFREEYLKKDILFYHPNICINTNFSNPKKTCQFNKFEVSQFGELTYKNYIVIELPELSEIFIYNKYKHYNSITIYLTWSSNHVDYTFILRDANMEECMKIFQNYVNIFSSFEFFCAILDNCTKKHEYLVIDNTVESNQLEDCVFWYDSITYCFKKHSNFFQNHIYPELIERAMHPSRILQCMDSDF